MVIFIYNIQLQKKADTALNVMLTNDFKNKRPTR